MPYLVMPFLEIPQCDSEEVFGVFLSKWGILVDCFKDLLNCVAIVGMCVGIKFAKQSF